MSTSVFHQLLGGFITETISTIKRSRKTLKPARLIKWPSMNAMRLLGAFSGGHSFLTICYQWMQGVIGVKDVVPMFVKSFFASSQM
jgi:hypothetical protein